MEFRKNFISITEKDDREKSFNKDFPLSLTKQLGIQSDLRDTIPWTGKAHRAVLETLEDRFCKFFPTYLEKDAKKRPEDMRVTFEKLKDKCPTMEQFTDLLGKHMNKYNNTPSGGIDMDGKCPDQVYFENLAVKNEVHDKSILRILCGTFDERTVQKNGVQYQGRFYYHTDLIAHQGEKVIHQNYDPSNMDE